jgi:hypothetical protein
MIKKKLIPILVIAISMCTFMQVSAADVSYKIQAAIFSKVIGFNKGIAGEVSIYVMGSKDMAASLKKAIGKKAGKGVIKSITSGDAIPSVKPSVIYIDKSVANLAEVLKYCKDNGVMSITGCADHVKGGVALGLKLAAGKPKILLGTVGTKEMNIKWNPVIFKLAEKV